MKKLPTICLFMAATFSINAQEKKEYYKNGQLWTIENYTNGKRNGEFKSYHENGKLNAIGKYANDEPSGEWKIYDDYGILKSIENQLYGGKGSEIKIYSQNRTLIAIGSYEKVLGLGNPYNAIRTGEWKYYHENGKLDEIGSYSKGRTGEWKAYHENGQLSSLGNYSGDVKYDEWKYYYKNGHLTLLKTPNTICSDCQESKMPTYWAQNGNTQRAHPPPLPPEAMVSQYWTYFLYFYTRHYTYRLVYKCHYPDFLHSANYL